MRILILLLAVAITASSCSKDEDENFLPPEQNLFDQINEYPGLSLYSEAMVMAGLDMNLSNDRITALAPNDSAIQSFLDSYQVNSLSQLKEKLGDFSFRQLWEYSLINAKMQLADFETSYLPSSSENSSGHKINLFSERHQNSLLINGVARITDPDHQAENGYFHVSDQVLSPATLLTLVRANPKLSTLKMIMDLPGISTSVTLNQENGDFTLLAPTDQAFNDFLSSNAFAGVEGLQNAYGTANLDLVLKYHLLIFSITAEEFSNETYSTLYSSYQIQVTRSDSGLTFTDQKGNVADLVLSNITAINGTLHSIDKVLMPF